MQVAIDKNAVSIFASFPLQGKRDQIAEAAKWHGILVGKETVIGREADLGAVLHRLCDQCGPQLSGDLRGNGFGEEYPDMAAVSRPRPFEGCGNSFCVTGCQQRSGIVRPAFLVEVSSKEPACFVLQQWIYAGNKVA
ncbi:hypothetical protein LAV88_21620 [Rhizobium sp. VS19-DR104.1]|nr:hypothetical protein [Rhizobium sp. VS19-DR96]MBZ5762057.1 hypothetical protein [Rhizobium sp. VS19-DR96]MBZ5768170.1 hypothetical protein [Rhizobium sp. VS19-DR129.2]MBZ5843654.1 hypothetical protein [Rhizobium sp. VS19-DR104.1]